MHPSFTARNFFMVQISTLPGFLSVCFCLRETDRQTDRQRDRQTDRQKDRQTDRQTDRQRERVFSAFAGTSMHSG